MRVLFDQNVPRPLQKTLAPHDVKRAAEMGWSEIRNGDLLESAEKAGFQVLLSGDKRLRYEQNMTGRRIAVICMSATHWPMVKNHVAAIREAVDIAQPGTLTSVECRKFVPYKFR